jgi:hypothetical protein
MYLHPSSVISRGSPKYLVFHDVQETSKRFMMDATAIDPSWLDEFAPSYFHMDPHGGGDSDSVDVDVDDESRLTRRMKFS